MARPRKFYVHLDAHAPPSIHHGLAELHRQTGRRHAMKFKDRLRAEEFAAWWEYEHRKNAAAAREALRARLTAKGSPLAALIR